MSIRHYMVSLNETVIGIDSFTILNFCGRNGFVGHSAIVFVDGKNSNFTLHILTASRQS